MISRGNIGKIMLGTVPLIEKPFHHVVRYIVGLLLKEEGSNSMFIFTTVYVPQ